MQKIDQFKDEFDSKSGNSFSAEKIRKYYGMTPVKTGHRSCLRCERRFFSENLSLLKICNTCKHKGYIND